MSTTNCGSVPLNDDASTAFLPFPHTDSVFTEQHNGPGTDELAHNGALPEWYLQLGILEDFSNDSVPIASIAHDLADSMLQQDPHTLKMVSTDSQEEQLKGGSEKTPKKGRNRTKSKTSTESSNRRQKINISYIDDNRKRQVSFCKRKNGAMKKGRELNLMTGSMIGIFVFNPANGWYHEFGTHDPIEILTEYANFTGPSERRRDAKFFDELENAAKNQPQPSAHTQADPVPQTKLMGRRKKNQGAHIPDPAPPLPLPGTSLEFHHASTAIQDAEVPTVDPSTGIPQTIIQNKIHVVPESDGLRSAPRTSGAHTVPIPVDECNNLTFPVQHIDPTPVYSVNDGLPDECTTQFESNEPGRDVLTCSSVQNDDILQQVGNCDNLHEPALTNDVQLVNSVEPITSGIDALSEDENEYMENAAFLAAINSSSQELDQPVLLRDEQTTGALANFLEPHETDSLDTEAVLMDGIVGTSESLGEQSMFIQAENENTERITMLEQNLFLWENEPSVSHIGRKRALPNLIDEVPGAKVRRIE